jgi:hypothetical protein
MMPNPVNWWCWSIGEKVFSGDIWTCDKKVFEDLPENQIFVLAHNDGQLRIDEKNYVYIGNSGTELEEGIYKISSKDHANIKVSLLEEF